MDQFAEPAEHQDEINAFFFVTYLLEYVDYLHVAGDNGTFGRTGFPDDYPNKKPSRRPFIFRTSTSLWTRRAERCRRRPTRIW